MSTTKLALVLMTFLAVTAIALRPQNTIHLNFGDGRPSIKLGETNKEQSKN